MNFVLCPDPLDDRRRGQLGTARPRARRWMAAVSATALLFALASSLTATELHRAIKDGDIGYLQDRLINGDPALIATPIGRGVTPLHLAAALDNSHAARLLLEHGADVDVRSEGGFTPLHWAASRDAVATMGVLLAGGADINALTLKGITPLHWAANRGAINAVRLLVDSGADVEMKTADGMSPLHWAVENDAMDVAKIIAEKVVAMEMEAAADLPAPTTRVRTEPAPAAPADKSPVLSNPEELTDIYITPRGPDSGRALVVEIGLGETLVFEWIRSLDIWAGKYEVTNGQYRRFKPSHSSLFRESFSLDGNDQPAAYVNWHDAQAYCDWLNRTYRDRLPQGFRFRLPHGVEWIFLARCGQNRTYPWGNRWPPRYGNFSDMTARANLRDWQGVDGYDDGFVVSCPVDQSGINEWGLYGMAGNVWEWCEDWYSESRQYKVRMGGSWDFDTEPNLRIASVGFDRPDVRDDTIGFRLVASPE